MPDEQDSPRPIGFAVGVALGVGVIVGECVGVLVGVGVGVWVTVGVLVAVGVGVGVLVGLPVGVGVSVGVGVGVAVLLGVAVGVLVGARHVAPVVSSMFWGHPHALQSATASVQALLVAPILLQMAAQLFPEPSTSLQSGPMLTPQRFEGAPPQLQQKAAQGDAVPSKRAKTLPTSPSAKIDRPGALIPLRCALIASTSIDCRQGLYSVVPRLSNGPHCSNFPPSVSKTDSTPRPLHPAKQRVLPIVVGLRHG